MKWAKLFPVRDLLQTETESGPATHDTQFVLVGCRVLCVFAPLLSVRATDMSRQVRPHDLASMHFYDMTEIIAGCFGYTWYRVVRNSGADTHAAR